MQKINEFLLPAGIGAIFAALGYFAKLVIDYFYLKSPRLKPDVKVRSTGSGPLSDGFRRYGFLIIIDIYNHSSNIAYDFNVISFRVSADFATRVADLSFLKNPITDQLPLNIEFEYHSTFEITEKFHFENGSLLLNDLNKTYILKCSYKNALGKKYIRTYHGQMTRDNEINLFQSW